MQLMDVLLLAVGLSMDAFAVSICKGLALKKITLKNAGVVGLWFGGFQALMPLLGFLIGSLFARVIRTASSWIAFGLLALIGVNMIREAFGGEEEQPDAALCAKTMLVMAVATSIDAMAVGITFALEGVYIHILLTVAIIGVVTCVLSMLGVKVGSVFGNKYEKKAQVLGGCILILLGVKILLEHLGVL